MQDENTLGTRAAPLQSAHSSGNPKFGPWMVVSRKGKFKSNKEREAVRDLVQNQYGKFEGGSRFSLLASGTEMEKGTKSTNDTPIANVNSMNDSETNMPASQFSHQAKSTRKFPSKKPAKPTNKNNSIALNNKPLSFIVLFPTIMSFSKKYYRRQAVQTFMQPTCVNSIRQSILHMTSCLCFDGRRYIVRFIDNSTN